MRESFVFHKVVISQLMKRVWLYCTLLSTSGKHPWVWLAKLQPWTYFKVRYMSHGLKSVSNQIVSNDTFTLFCVGQFDRMVIMDLLSVQEMEPLRSEAATNRESVYRALVRYRWKIQMWVYLIVPVDMNFRLLKACRHFIPECRKWCGAA